MAVALALLLLSSPALVLSCSVPKGGCEPSKCSALSALQGKITSNNWNTFAALGTFYGAWNSVKYPNQTASRSVKGGPWVGYEVYPNVESAFFLPSPAATTVTTLSGCCSLCAQTSGCAEYQFFESGDYTKIKRQPSGTYATAQPGGSYVKGQQCYLLTGGSVTGTWPLLGANNNGPYGTPLSGDHSLQLGSNNVYPPSFVGGTCNPAASVVDDPHFVGAQGTHFDFNGEIGRTFVLVSDQGLNLNVKLGGYESEETFGATEEVNGKALRTWIEEIGLTWVGTDGKRHTAVFVARDGKEQAVGSGFMAAAVVDGKAVAVPQPEGEDLAAAGLSLSHLGVTKKGPYDLEMFQLKVGDKLEARLHMRVAHAKLQTPTEAHAHFNIHITGLKATGNVHGILGQTYRPTAEQKVKALRFSTLANMFGNPIKADGETGKGFLDGAVGDYATSSITSEDSKFSAAITA